MIYNFGVLVHDHTVLLQAIDNVGNFAKKDQIYLLQWHCCKRYKECVYFVASSVNQKKENDEMIGKNIIYITLFSSTL